MDINFWTIGFSTIGLLLLILFIYFSISGKSIWSGLIVVAVLSVMLLLIAVPIIGLFGLAFLYQYVPERIQFHIGLLSTFIGLFFTNVFAFIPSNRRRKMAGDFVDKEQRKIAQLMQGAIWFLFAYCLFTTQGALLPHDYVFESFRRNIFWWIVIICLVLYSYYLFEYREKGFVHRGKVILFSNIEHAEWADKWNKVKLKVRLKNTQEEIVLKTPLDMSSLIDGYLGKNFPRP